MTSDLTEAVFQSMYEISIRMSNDDLRALSQTPLWEAVKEASKHEFWWYRRVEQLVGQELTYRVGAWSIIYASVCRFGPTFDHRHNDDVPIGTSARAAIALAMGICC